MNFPFKQKWRALRRGSPGRRFLRTYENARRHPESNPPWQRLLQFGLALAALALGVVFAVLPGPAFVFFGLAGALLAPESRSVAMLLDWLELRLRRIFRWTIRHWKKLPPLTRKIVVALGASGTAAVAGLAFWIFFRR